MLAVFVPGERRRDLELDLVLPIIRYPKLKILFSSILFPRRHWSIHGDAHRNIPRLSFVAVLRALHAEIDHPTRCAP